MNDEAVVCPACGEDSLVWLSGKAGVFISLNGNTAAYCSNAACGVEVWLADEEEV